MISDMKLILLALICISDIISSVSWPSEHLESQPWNEFKGHDRVYNDQAEEASRFSNFLVKRKLVELQNAKPSTNFTIERNYIADWSPEEIAKLYGFRHEGEVDRITEEDLKYMLNSNDPSPAEVDWRLVEGRVTGVKVQGKCGSGWAFATTGLLEGQEKARNLSSLVSLSEQQLIDCSTSCKGCTSGYMAAGLDDIALKLGGLEAETDYAYEGVQGKCRLDKSKLVFTAKGHKMLPIGDEKTLGEVVASYGPVAVAFESTSYTEHYSGGILHDPLCGKKLNHAVLIVGYGKDPEEGDYWIVKNSWGTNWGEAGYMRMKRGINQCGIAEMPTIAIF